MLYDFYFFFFFQAEDGIRDSSVTGVQTCALPIFNNDAYQQLVANGAQILSQSGNPRDGFRYDYKLGKSIGTLTILPLAITAPSLIHRREPLPVGTVDVTARIEQREMWFPKEPETIQIQASIVSEEIQGRS